ncbi:MAG: hypothetical protein GOV15_00770, partial [Candidatus Diapherotrites archaeon]|nr:hypothetical protein [Candidatus Diapherotrites archaeon]
MKKTKNKFNYYGASAASSLLLALLVVIAELSKPFKELLAIPFGHHWIGKIAVTAIVFVVIGLLLKEQRKRFGMKEADLAWYSALVSLAAIAVF